MNNGLANLPSSSSASSSASSSSMKAVQMHVHIQDNSLNFFIGLLFLVAISAILILVVYGMVLKSSKDNDKQKEGRKFMQLAMVLGAGFGLTIFFLQALKSHYSISQMIVLLVLIIPITVVGITESYGLLRVTINGLLLDWLDNPRYEERVKHNVENMRNIPVMTIILCLLVAIIVLML